VRQAPAAPDTTRRAVIAGASPTTANSLPPGASCSTRLPGSSGVEPVSTITS
jgi:hypothetical protein